MGIGIEDGIGVGDDSKSPGGGGGAVNTVNNVAPDAGGNVQLDASDVKARPDTWTPTAQETGAVATADMPDELKKLLDSGVTSDDLVKWNPVKGKLVKANLRDVNDNVVVPKGTFQIGQLAGYVGLRFEQNQQTFSLIPIDPTDKRKAWEELALVFEDLTKRWVCKAPLMVQDEVTLERMQLGDAGEMGLRVFTNANFITLQPFDVDGSPITGVDLAYNKTTKRWTINGRNIVLSDEFETLKARVQTNEDAITALQQAAGPSGSPTHHDPVGFDPSKAEVTGGFSADDWGGIVSFSTHKAGGDLTIHKTGSDAQYAYLLFKPTDATHVHGFKIDNGLEAQWPSKDVTLQGKQYTAFRSPYKLTMSPLDIETVWSK